MSGLSRDTDADILGPRWTVRTGASPPLLDYLGDTQQTCRQGSGAPRSENNKRVPNRKLRPYSRRSRMKPGSLARWLSTISAVASLFIAVAASAADVRVMISAGFFEAYSELAPAW